ncbi:MAG TPA: SDR family NAD(P)-dependent oxidoreductase, partial [Novosphingobium sp.]|nr:SDR family NAD(P)-dependent oxidoreductase [Novosphingobium sp.]
MTGTLAGRTALITGAGDGIGRAMAQRMAAQGASVIVAEYDAARGNACAQDIRAAGHQARFLPVDVTDRAAVLAMMAEAGPVDILVNNAWASQGMARIEAKSDAVFEASLRMALFAAKWTMEAALPHMKAQHWGRVINMASLNGVNAHMGSADYNAAKEAMRAYTRTAAREWAPLGICCNMICPAAMAASTRLVMAGQPGMIERI